MSFIIENNIVKLQKDCKMCSHVKICKYHSKMSDLCNSNEFYGMNEYLEWNNSLKVFEQYASCRYYKLFFDIPEDKSLHLEISKSIIDEIIRLEIPIDVTSWSVQKDVVIYNMRNSEQKTIEILDLINKYKFE